MNKETFKLDLIKMKNLNSVKATEEDEKTHWEKISANPTFDKGHAPSAYFKNF